MKSSHPMTDRRPSLSRRGFLAAGAASIVATAASGALAPAAEPAAEPADGPAVVSPPQGKRILLSCKLGMIAKEAGGKPLSLVERLKLAAQAGFDGVDFDEAGGYTLQQVRQAVAESGVFVHNAINHAHWQQRLTSANEAERCRAGPTSSTACGFRMPPAAPAC